MVRKITSVLISFKERIIGKTKKSVFREALKAQSYHLD